ncbi:MAG: hypothetical protein IJZ55_11715 [Lachnospiraceae bacterium]|nr:hypothetical protein [Lachnospiraceae bacterium]
MDKKKNWIIEAGIGLVGLLAFLAIWEYAKGQFQPEDFEPLTKWWRALLVLGIGFFPLSAFLFRKFSDKGYIFGKILGLVISGWLVWVLSALHIVKFTPTGCYVILILCIVVNYGLAIFFCRKKNVSVAEFFGFSDSAVVTKAIWYEVLFFAVFALLLYLKCFRPDFSWQTEGGMDYAFMISMLKSDYMPPEDFWYSGTDLNYYYLGQYFCTYLTQLSGVDITYAYNMALMTVGTVCMVLSYALASRILEVYMKERSAEYRLMGKRTVASSTVLQQILPRVAGLLAGCGVTFASTNHYWVYRKLGPILCDIMGVDGNHSYWVSDPTRYIGWQGEALDQTIHEFPAYSLMLGDLHAHVINIMFVLTLLGVLFAFLLERKDRMTLAVAGVIEPVSYKKEMLQPQIIVLSFFIGIFQMTNYWDFPIYFVVCGAVILVSNAVICGFNKKSLLLTVVHAAEFIVIAFVTALMFTVHFDSMASGIGICNRHTEPYQMIIVWGMPIAAVIGCLVLSIKREQKRREAGVTATEHKNVFFAWLQNLKASDLFLLIIGLCAVGLILMPELIYIKDIYGEVNQRTNTMFKLTYQAFILFGIFMGVFITKLVFLPKSGKQFVAGAIMLFILCRDVEYYGYAWERWAGDYKDKENYKHLDATCSTDVSEGDRKAAKWINENIEGRPTILEAHGPSYLTDRIVHCRISALTGCPTVIGWRTHEWLWKGDVEAVDERGEDVEAIYTGFDLEIAAELLKDYGVDKYGRPNDEMRAMLQEMFGVEVGDYMDKQTTEALLELIGVDPGICMGPEMAKRKLAEYDVDYIYVGEVEYLKYEDEQGYCLLDYEYLKSLGEVIYEDTEESEYYETFIVKLK